MKYIDVAWAGFVLPVDFYSVWDLTVFFVYITNLRVEVKACTMQTKDIIYTWTNTARYKVLPLGKSVCGMDNSICFLMSNVLARYFLRTCNANIRPGYFDYLLCWLAVQHLTYSLISSHDPYPPPSIDNVHMYMCSHDAVATIM